jgi:hypothetical protein
VLRAVPRLAVPATGRGSGDRRTAAASGERPALTVGLEAWRECGPGVVTLPV